jgi:hypothetical protein
MNAERLHRILIEVNNEFIDSAILDKMIAVRDNLQNQVNQPQQPAYQQNLVTSLQTLYETLENSKTNNFSPGWTELINEIGGDGIFGNDVKNIIKNIFATNQITPSAALQDIIKIVTKTEAFRVSVVNLLSAFEGLNIGAEDLEAGNCELGYTIPRIFVKNELKSLNKEISELNFILTTISEAVTGEKKEFEVKTISSSDFLFVVGIGIYLAKVISEVVEKIIENYKKILEIKKLRNELKAAGVPEKETKGIEQHANSSMEKEILKLATEIIKNSPLTDELRKNELNNGVTIALNKIANRIDCGFNIEIRVKELPVAKDNKTDENHEFADMIKIINSNSKMMEFIKTGGQPILQLNENEPT